MKAKQVFYFVTSIIVFLGIIMIIFPKEGIRINDEIILYFPSFDEMFGKNKEIDKINLDSILTSHVDIENVIFETRNSQEQTETETETDIDIDIDIDIEALKNHVTALEFPEDNPHVLDSLFKKLQNIESRKRVRILHYGDSQIEGDRITAILRNKLQSRFGGVGVGLCSPVAVYSQFSIKQKNSDNWERYTGFGYGKPSQYHKKYGPMIAFNRFAPETDSSWQKPESQYSAWLEFTKSNIGYSNTHKFKKISILYGNSKENIQIRLKSDNTELISDSLQTGDELYVYTYISDDFLENLRIEFEGYDSPDFYGISLEDHNGVYMDNIALRGSSGIVFTKNDKHILKQSFSFFQPDLFILQFGGNSVPFVIDKKATENLGNSLYSQMRQIKNLNPNACIIFIGPSDMSIKDKDSFVSYPNLPQIIDALRDATFRAGGAYWNTYAAMGGHNSMLAWVNNAPPLAGADYVHFTSKGSSLISNKFYNAFILEYSKYIKRKIND